MVEKRRNFSTQQYIVMVYNPAHDLFSIGHFLCHVRVVDCCDLRNGAERQWFIVATISGNFSLLKSLLAGTKTVMHRYGPNDTYQCVFNIKRTTYPYLLADFFDASQFEMINFANVNIEHYNSDPRLRKGRNILQDIRSGEEQYFSGPNQNLPDWKI